MNYIKDTELILTNKQKVYHLNIDKNDIADNIILVGDQNRVHEVSKYFDKISNEIEHREFITHTGTYKNKQVSVISTGIGCDNIDIVVNELDAAANIDFNSRTINKEKKSLNLIRIGTSGAIQGDIPIDSFLMSRYALGFDGLAYFHKNNKYIDKELTRAFNIHSNWPTNLSKPYIIKGSENLLRKFNGFEEGITATTSGFYSPQGRTLRLESAIPNMHDMLNSFEYDCNKITNFEMESSALYFLGQSLGHNTITICAIMGNRINQTQSNNYKETINKLIVDILERL